MAWHAECYHRKFGGYRKGYNAHYDSKCEGAALGLCYHASGIISALQGHKYIAVKNRERSSYSKPYNSPFSIPATTVEFEDPPSGEVREEVMQFSSENSSDNKSPTASEVASLVISQLSRIIGNKIDQSLEGKINKPEDLINAVVKELNKNKPIVVEVKNLEGEVKNVGVQHKQFPILLKAANARVNVWLAGPSGSGKTTAAMNVAEALNLSFRYTGAVNDAYALTGYNDANGRYVRTQFREAWENGGVFLWDEVDASDPSALLAFNAALANDTAPFPDACVKKHKDCILIAAANTWGAGATNEYVGRLKLDAAFLKRFAFLSWDYDDQMEMATAPNPEWTKRVQTLREAVKKKGIRALITPRESYIGAKLLEIGIDQDTVEQMTVKSGLTNEQWDQIAASTSYAKPMYDKNWPRL